MPSFIRTWPICLPISNAGHISGKPANQIFASERSVEIRSFFHTGQPTAVLALGSHFFVSFKSKAKGFCTYRAFLRHLRTSACLWHFIALSTLFPTFLPTHLKPFNAMLEYAKTILLKVSFDKILFEKELRKALRTLVPAELSELKAWCYQQFSALYHRLLNRVFTQPTVA